MARFVSDCLRIMRLAISRRNKNDPDSTDDILRGYINDAVSLSMTDDVKLFENFGTLEFSIDESVTDGVYTFNDVGASSQFSGIGNEGFISLSEPPDESLSWNRLYIYYDPGTFYGRWGINNTKILVPGFPTEMLFYGTEFVFRTIPDISYDVTLYGYEVIPEFSSEGNPEIPQDYWMRYIAYLAARDYARDYRYEEASLARIEHVFSSERALLMARTHNQIKHSRAIPRF